MTMNKNLKQKVGAVVILGTLLYAALFSEGDTYSRDDTWPVSDPHGRRDELPGVSVGINRMLGGVTIPHPAATADATSAASKAVASASAGNVVPPDTPLVEGTHLPKILWIYWAQGIEHLKSQKSGKYKTDYACVKGLVAMNPDWDVRVLSDKDGKLLTTKYGEFLGRMGQRKVPGRIKSNIIRLELISKYGGIYADSSTCPFVPLDSFIHKWVGPESDGFFAPPLHYEVAHTPAKDFRPELKVERCHDMTHVRSTEQSANYRTANSWFLAAPPNNPVINAWLETYLHNLYSVKEIRHPYYIVQCSLTQSRMKDEEIDAIWFDTFNRIDALRNPEEEVLGQSYGCCFGSEIKNWSVERVADECFFVKKPYHSPVLDAYVNSEEYMEDVEKKVGEWSAKEVSTEDEVEETGVEVSVE